VVPVKPFSERSANQGIAKSEILTQVSKGNHLDDSKRGNTKYASLGKNDQKSTQHLENGSKRNASSGDEHKHDSSLHLKKVLKSFDPKTIKLQKDSVNDFSEKVIKPDRIGQKEANDKNRICPGGYVGIKPVMTPSEKKINLIKPNKVTSISPRRGGKGHHSDSKKEIFTQKKFDGQEVLDKSEEYLKLHPELTKALTALFEHLIQQLYRSQHITNAELSTTQNDRKMIKCDSDKGIKIANALTKIEEHEEIENEDHSNEAAEINCVLEAQSKHQAKLEKDNELAMKDENSNDFDPLKYAIEFFSSYNSDTNQFSIKSSLSSQG